jgi:hypothetical protein
MAWSIVTPGVDDWDIAEVANKMPVATSAERGSDAVSIAMEFFMQSLLRSRIDAGDG